MHFTNSKQSWFVQMCNSIDYSGRQCETLSLEMNLAAGQEIRSRVCMSESMLTAINSQRVCSLCWHSCLLTCCSTPCWPAHTPLPEMDCQGVGPGSEHSFFRLQKLFYSFSKNKNSPKKQTTAAAVKKKKSGLFNTLEGQVSVLILN